MDPNRTSQRGSWESTFLLGMARSEERQKEQALKIECLENRIRDAELELEALRRPSIVEADFERLQHLVITAIERRKSDPPEGTTEVRMPGGARVWTPSGQTLALAILAVIALAIWQAPRIVEAVYQEPKNQQSAPSAEK
jgi:hypothetical protein